MSNRKIHDMSNTPATSVPNKPSILEGSLGQHTSQVPARSERPLGIVPPPEDGVAIGGQPGLPEGHANVADKIVGKAEKVIGKHTNNPEMHERGELRETGGKAAAEGHARAAHD